MIKQGKTKVSLPYGTVNVHIKSVCVAFEPVFANEYQQSHCAER